MIRHFGFALGCLVLFGCGGGAAPMPDAGHDGGTPTPDASADTGTPDAASPDGGSPDAGSPDSGVCPDSDGDGHMAMTCGGDDCDDTNAAVHPGASETCDGTDEDCDGTVDGATANTWCSDPTRLGMYATGATCTAGACVLTCALGHVDCTAIAGCETRTSLTDCGACGRTCHGWGSLPAMCVTDACANDVTDVAPGYGQTCASLGGGSTYCWGAGTAGQLGIGTMINHTSPVHVDISHTIAVSTTSNASCALDDMGYERCWGSNLYDATGTGSSTSTPSMVVGLTDATQISSGERLGCALHSDGTVGCWGTAACGDGTMLSRIYPVTVSGITDAVQVSAGGLNGCILRATGQVMCWGDNRHGDLGDGTTTDSLVPVAVMGITDAVEIEVGEGFTFFACARHRAGTVSCWGTGGSLGDGSTTDSSLAVDVTGITDAVEIAAGGGFACARHATGTVSCWGNNFYGTLGDGSMTNSPSPVAVTGLTDAVHVTAGADHTCAIRATGDLVCWGDNFNGWLGVGGTANALVPTVVTPP